MIVKLLISLVLLGVFVFALLHRNVHAIMRFFLCAILALGIGVTWSPDSATILANKVGVSRGADLIFYMWILISMLVIVMIYTKFISMNRTVTKLARHIALTSARDPNTSGENEHE